jgi:Rrf2 family iron-sulfur cluster assembly transcriptional regulator
MEQLFAKMRRKGLVESVRGPGGGYRLGRDAADISVAEVIEAVNETTDATRCKGKGGCQKGETCLTHHLWMDLSDQIHLFLSDITLADLVARREVQSIARQQQEHSGEEQQAGELELHSLSEVAGEERNRPAANTV